MTCPMSQFFHYCCLLWCLTICVRSDGNFFQRNRDFDNLFKAGLGSIVYKVSRMGPCGMYAIGSGCSSFFFNVITRECRLVYETLSDVGDAEPYLGNRYFVKHDATTHQGAPLPSECSQGTMVDGFTPAPVLGLCFKVFNISKSWAEAKSECETHGYQLIVLDTLPKAQTLAGILRASTRHNADGYWIGLSVTEGWVDGSAIADTNWGTPGQTLQSGQCVRMDRHNNYMWVKEQCNSGRSYICQAV